MCAKIHLEAIGTSPNDCQIAEDCGADQIELVAAIELGGLTPTSAVVARCVQTVSIPVYAMVRIRGGGFCYSREEIDLMAQDSRTCMEAGAAGIVFGAVTPAGMVDLGAWSQILDAAGAGEHGCHRAFDAVADRISALDQLVALGVARVLSSGGAKTALQGSPRLQTLIQNAPPSITVMAAGGIRSHNVGEVVRQTGCTMVHAGALRDENDLTPASEVSYGSYKVVDSGQLASLRNALDNISGL
ncbi:MAG: copper homeostasis protein CutC [Armatimonadetes bacterium]|nr:copper homeostasis protein CutC [Armatimonadota bacterium]